MSCPINGCFLGGRFLGAFSIATLALASTALAQSPVKIGVLEDQSGDFAAATMPKVTASNWRPTKSIRRAASPAGRSSS